MRDRMAAYPVSLLVNASTGDVEIPNILAIVPVANVLFLDLGPPAADSKSSIRHVKGVEVRYVEIRCMRDDQRPGFVLEDVDGTDFTHVKAVQAADRPTFVLRNVKDFNIYDSRPLPDAHLDSVEKRAL